MPYRAPPDAASTDALRPLTAGIALGAIAVNIVATVLFTIDLATRPPCLPGFTRFLDVEPALRFIAVAFAALAGVAYWRSRRGTRLLLWFTIAIIVCFCAVLLTIGAVATLVHNHGERYDVACWTF